MRVVFVHGIVTAEAAAGSVVEINAGHHPFLSQPEAVADLIMSLS